MTATIATIIAATDPAEAAVRPVPVVALTPSAAPVGPQPGPPVKSSPATCTTDTSKHRRACLKIGGRAPKHSVQAGTVSPSVAPFWCEDLTADEWWISRSDACVHDQLITYTVYEDGEPIGSALIALDQEVELSSSSLAWNEISAVTVISEEGAAVGLSAETTASCKSNCSSGSITDGGVLEPEEPLLLWYDFAADIGAGAVQRNIQTTYSLTIVQPDAVPIKSTSFYGPGDIRCDDTIGNNGGCVNTLIPAILEYSLSDTSVNQAAAGYLFAQNVLPDHWGTAGHELHRIADTSIAESNRNVVCDITFVPDPTLNPIQDSCDEFAFASSNESGAQLTPKQSGLNCDEIWPFSSGGGWYVEEIRFSGTERCQQAHVENAINGNAGLALGRFVQQQRVLDGEAYRLVVTS